MSNQRWDEAGQMNIYEYYIPKQEFSEDVSHEFCGPLIIIAEICVGGVVQCFVSVFMNSHILELNPLCLMFASFHADISIASFKSVLRK